MPRQGGDVVALRPVDVDEPARHDAHAAHSDSRSRSGTARETTLRAAASATPPTSTSATSAVAPMASQAGREVGCGHGGGPVEQGQQRHREDGAHDTAERSERDPGQHGGQLLAAHGRPEHGAGRARDEQPGEVAGHPPPRRDGDEADDEARDEERDEAR